MRITKTLWVAMVFIALDSVLRMSILGFWIFAPESAPNVPVFYKGIQYPELQAGMLTFNAIGPIAFALPALRSPEAFGVLQDVFFAFGGAMLVVSFFHSANVAGSAFIYAMAAIGFRESARGSCAQQGPPVGRQAGEPASRPRA